MRKILIIGSILIQLFTLIYMAAMREAIILTGKIVYLRTAPVDPNDLFRGDYVSLNYEISQVPLKEAFPAGEKEVICYTVLKKGENDLYGLDYCSMKKPDSDQIFIKGKNDYSRYYDYPPRQQYVTLKYGIEKYFVQQKKGLDIEKRAGFGNAIHIPLEMEVALGSDGTAVAKGFRWSPIGIGLQITEASQLRNNWNGMNNEEQPQENKDVKIRKSPKIRLTLKNTSDKPLAIVNLPDFRSFKVIPANPEKKWTFSKKFTGPLKPRNEDVIVLAPDQATSFDFDFAEPRWFVDGKNGPDEIGVVCNEWDDMFRIVYAPPSPEECQDLNKKENIWHGELPSRRFSTGRID